jgi:mRNA interferase YafQ
MYQIDYTNRFKKDLKRCSKRGLDMKKIFEVIKLLQQDGTLPIYYRPHRLVGDRDGQWECHIQSDWLLVWEQNDVQLKLLFLQTGTHSDLF